MDDDLTELVRTALAPLDPASQADAEADVAGLDAAGVNTVEDLLRVGPAEPADPGVRQLAYWLLGRSGQAEAMAALDRGLDDPDPRARREAVAAAGPLLAGPADEPIVRRLEQLLAADPDVNVRVAAALALSGRASAVGPLLLAMRDFAQPPTVRGAAAEALAHHPDDTPAPALREALSDAEPAVRGWAAFAAGERGDREALPKLDELARNDRAMVPGLGTVAEEARDAAEAIRAGADNR
jgi:HEAT repeat protein